jgi:hypothetical protein
MKAPPFTDTQKRLVFVRELLTEIERSFSVQSGGHAVNAFPTIFPPEKTELSGDWRTLAL